MSKRYDKDRKFGSSSKRSAYGISSTKNTGKKKFLFGDVTCNYSHVTGFPDAKNSKKEDNEISNFSSSGEEDHAIEDLFDNTQETEVQKDLTSFVGASRSNSMEINLNISQFRDTAEENEKIAWSDTSQGDSTVSDDEDYIQDPFQTQEVRPKKMNISIKQYCSDDEDNEPQKIDDESPGQQASNSQYSIKNPTPSPLPSVTCNKVDSKDTPGESVEEFEESDSEADNDVSVLNFSTKPGKKYRNIVKGGLVERLIKLRKREQSDLVFWKFNKSDRDASTAIYTQVKCVRVVFSVASVVCKLTEDMEFFVMLPLPMFNEMKIEQGSKIRIFPPWNKVFLKEMNSISLLCAYRIEVLPQTSELISTPATEDLLTFQHKESAMDIDLQQLNNLDGKNFDASDDKAPHSAQSRQQQNEEGQSSNNILQAVEQSGYSQDISFTARVQRVYCRCLKKCEDFSPLQHISSQTDTDSECRFALLVQDGDGCLGEIKLPHCDDAINTQWTSFICSCEGKVFSFSKLKLVKQIPKDRNASIQSMINLFERNTKENATKKFLVNKLFIFDYHENGSRENENADFLEIPIKEFAVEYQPPCLLSRNNAVSSSRVTVDLRLITVSCKKDGTSPSVKSFQHSECSFYGNSLATTHTKIILVKIYETCHIPGVLCKLICREGRTGESCISVRIKDVRIQDTDFIADGYSIIFLLLPNGVPYNDSMFAQHSSSALLLQSMTSSIIQPFKDSIQIGELVSLQGDICGIEEESALCWNVCERCTSDDITETDTGSYFCGNCSSTTSCQMKVELSVILYLASYSDSWILCKLLEDTILRVLPSPVSTGTNGFNGHDVKSILGKQLHLPVCVVVDITRKDCRQKTDLYVLKESRPLCTL